MRDGVFHRLFHLSIGKGLSVGKEDGIPSKVPWASGLWHNDSGRDSLKEKWLSQRGIHVRKGADGRGRLVRKVGQETGKSLWPKGF
jgi:hypothetical protein